MSRTGRPTLSGMRDQVTGLRASALAAVGLAAALAAACGGSSSIVPAPSTFFTNVNACGAVSGVTTGDAAIVNGTACTSGTASVARLLMTKENETKPYASCSGSVISSTAVLTAAHCLVDAGSVSISFGSKEIQAASFSYSPGYNGTAPDSIDVGVIIAASPLGQPIVPILSSRDANVGETVVIAGYGQDGPAAGGDTLRAGTTKVSQVGSLFLETNAGVSGSGACPGDSGGPALVSVNGFWTVAGITSTLAGPCVVATNTFLSVRNATVRSFILSKAPDAAQR
jgi:V8-like Glu-specific endopeptidase